MTELGDLSGEHGTEMVAEARRIITEFLSRGQTARNEEFDSKFGFRAGVFVTLSKRGSLRGCIGFPLPSRRLCDGLADAAVSAATRDPRFRPVSPDEMGVVALEVTVLTAPVKIVASRPEEYVASVIIGRHGLIVENGHSSGLLLPQVPAEYGWDAEEFLAHTCIKAELDADAWKDESTRVSKFEGVIFKEEAPNGRVVMEAHASRRPPE